VLLAQGDLAGALLAYRDSMTIRARLAAADPANFNWQRDLSVSHERIGDILAALGDLAGAVAAYRARHEIAARLGAADRANAEWQRDLAVSYNRMGYVLRAQHDLSGALAAYRESMAIAARLAAADPANRESQRDLFVNLFRIATLLLRLGEADAACPMAQQVDTQARLLAERFPQDQLRDLYLRMASDLLTRACSPGTA